MSSADRAALIRALSAYDHERPAEVRPLLEQLVRRYPGNFEATETLGLINAERGDFATALPLVEKARAIRPSSGLALANLGTAYLKLRRNADAVRALQRAAVLDPKNRETQSALGQALMLLGRPADAAWAFGAACANGPPDADLLYNWAVALLSAGKAKRAGEVVATIPDAQTSAQAQSLWGEIEEKNGNFGAALEHDQRTAQLDPSETNLYALGLELMRGGIFPAASKILAYAVEKYPESARLQFSLGLARYGSHDYAGSAAIFSPLLQREPNSSLYADGADNFTDVSYQVGLAEPTIPFLSWGNGFLDFDNDGWLDIFFANGHVYPSVDQQDWGTTRAERPQLFRNIGGTRFDEFLPLREAVWRA